MEWTMVDMDGRIGLQFDFPMENKDEIVKLVRKHFGGTIEDEELAELVKLVPEFESFCENFN